MRISIPVAALVLWSLACSGGSVEGPPEGPLTPAPEPPPPPAETGPDLVLDALVATSGDAVALLDGRDDTAWRPFGDASGEGVLVRFAEPTTLSRIQVDPCEVTARASLRLYLDGADSDWVRSLAPGEPAVWGQDVLTGPVRSVFFKVEGAVDPVCAAHLHLAGEGDVALAVAPPATVPGTVEATSTLSPADAYHPAYLFDRRTDFGWVEGADGLGVGEAITARFERPVRARALELHNGYQRSADHFEKNARALALVVSVDGGEAVEVAVADASGAQTVDLPASMEGRAWRFEIAAAEPGSRYEDLVLSELRLVGDEGPFGLAGADLARRQEALLEEVRDQPLGTVVDREWSSACLGEVISTTKLRSNHSFVRYEEGEGPDGGWTEVFDGAWVVASQGDPWSTVKLYGRRHTVASVWQPYVGDATTESTRVSGGTVEVARVEDLGPEAMEALASELPLDCPPFDELAARHAVVLRGKAMVDVVAEPAG